jgi:hypothetical protein
MSLATAQPPLRVWYAIVSPGERTGERAVHGVVGDAHPDGARVTLTPAEFEALPPSNSVGWTARGRQRIRTLAVLGVQAPGPAPWFVLLGAAAPAERVGLMAFMGEGVAANTVIDEVEATALAVDAREQVGAVEWEPATGVVRQIFVQPHLRRRRIGTILFVAASAVHQFHGWTGVLRVDGARTELGETFVQAHPIQHRVAPWTRLVPPMDRDAEG